MLDPIEGLSDETADEDYLSLMRAEPRRAARRPTDASDPMTHRPVERRATARSRIGGRPILRGIDLTVEPGEFLALMGANGSGKSTLVRALTGLRAADRRRASRLFGTPLADFRDWQRVGFVPQRSAAATGVPASVWEVVASGRLTRRRLLRPLSRGRPAPRSTTRSRWSGWPTGPRDGVSTLSGGQQQRVLIARALAGEPELLFLDEPTAGVDLPNQQALADALAPCSRTRGATIVLVAHELGPLAPLVDRAVVMRDGRVAYDGPPLADDDVHRRDLDGARTTTTRPRAGTTTRPHVRLAARRPRAGRR